MIRLALRVAREQSELVLAELLELAPGGVEEVEVGEGVIEYAVYGAPGELPALPDLRAAAGGALVEVRSAEVPDDWADRWRAFHKPLVLGGQLAVRPPWEPPTGAAVEIVIDPGLAFGTGAHPTTRLCLELLLGLAAGEGFVDVGCGSGVLAIAAAALGWREVLALDNDRSAVQAARANAAANGAHVAVQRLDVRDEAVPVGFQTVAANLLGPLLERHADRIAGAGEQVIASGLLAAEANRIAGAFASRGMRPKRKLVSGDWAALLLERE